MFSSFNLIRYDHYGTLCELLPAALPSLAYCLQALRHGKVSLLEVDCLPYGTGASEKPHFGRGGRKKKKTSVSRFID